MWSGWPGATTRAARRRFRCSPMSHFSRAACAIWSWFRRLARGLQLDVLVEVHTAAELDRVLGALGETGADAVGVNNRNLKTFEVRLETSLELVERMPAGILRVAESGISTAEDLARLRAAGFDAFLIGESLMRQADPGAALAEMLARARWGPGRS